MSPRPKTVTGLRTEPGLATTTLRWDSLGFDPLIDHYRVYAVQGEDAPSAPEESSLLAKTVYPRLVHQGLDPAGETWTYTVVAVSDAGVRGAASSPVTGSSQGSVTATGTPVAVIGAFDGRTLEHRFAPSSYSSIPAAYPEAVIEYRDGEDSPETAWPYLLPGPGDAWAGRKAYRARWAFSLQSAPAADLDLAVWLVDTTRLGGILRVSANGEQVTDLTLPPGATRGSRDGDATVPGSTLRRTYFELAVPGTLLQEGENMIEFELAEGGWLAWDAVGLFARS